LVLNLPLEGEWLFLHIINNPEQVSEHIKMVFPYTGFLVGTCHFIYLCLTCFRLAFRYAAAWVGNLLGICFQ